MPDDRAEPAITEILITLSERNPPAGWASANGLAPTAFQGWLGLLHVLADVLGGNSEDTP